LTKPPSSDKIEEKEKKEEKKMLQSELQRERNHLKERIARLQADLQPGQRELQELWERLTHVEALLPIEEESREEGAVALPRGGWANICREHGWQVRGDSAHRVVRREDPALHQSIVHWCVYDDRQYP